ncbi:hypothetical protein QTP88_012022 [Uroleucon formosanum]
MADSDVRDMLTAWGLESYVDVFKDHGIDLSCFSLLTDDMLKDMIPMIGHRAKFRANLEEWRKVLALANNQASVIYCSSSSSSSSTSNRSSRSRSSSSSSSSRVVVVVEVVVVVVVIVVIVVVRPCFCLDSQKINSTALIINKTQALPAVRSVGWVCPRNPEQAHAGGRGEGKVKAWRTRKLSLLFKTIFKKPPPLPPPKPTRRPPTPFWAK